VEEIMEPLPDILQDHDFIPDVELAVLPVELAQTGSSVVMEHVGVGVEVGVGVGIAVGVGVGLGVAFGPAIPIAVPATIPITHNAIITTRIILIGPPAITTFFIVYLLDLYHD
jgi:hypothetical protein